VLRPRTAPTTDYCELAHVAMRDACLGVGDVYTPPTGGSRGRGYVLSRAVVATQRRRRDKTDKTISSEESVLHLQKLPYCTREREKKTTQNNAIGRPSSRWALLPYLNYSHRPPLQSGILRALLHHRARAPLLPPLLSLPFSGVAEWRRGGAWRRRADLPSLRSLPWQIDGRRRRSRGGGVEALEHDSGGGSCAGH
jgi:hypothetical protein